MINLPTVNFTYLERINKFDEDIVQVTDCPFEEAKAFIDHGHLSVKEYAELLVEQNHPTIEQLALFACWWNCKEVGSDDYVWDIAEKEEVDVMIGVLIELITREL